MPRPVRVLLTAVLLAGAASAWWSGLLPCTLVVAQPACQLLVTGGPVLDTTALLTLGPPADGGRAIAIREPTGRLLVTTIEVSEPGSVAAWWAGRRDGTVEVIARTLLVPPGGDLGDVADIGRTRMEESQQRAVGLALRELGVVATPDASWAWPVEARFATDTVGGPSAGLMLALSIIARLAPEDPTARLDDAALPPIVVAGTGALDADGRVLGVGGVTHKLRSVVTDPHVARLPDAFFLPVDDLASARRIDVPSELMLVPVGSLAEAVAALDALRQGGTPAGAVVLGAGHQGGR